MKKTSHIALKLFATLPILSGGVLMNGQAVHAAEGKSASAKAVPADMVGNWRWTTISAGSYVDTTTGRSESASGMSANFIFSKNGTYKYNFYTKMRTYGLVTEVFTTHEGKVSFYQGKFVLHPTKGHYLGSYNGKTRVDRDMTAAELKKNNDYLWKWVEEDGSRKLMIGPTAQSLSHFKPNK